MKFYSFRNRVTQQHFLVYWESSKTNKGDYFIKKILLSSRRHTPNVLTQIKKVSNPPSIVHDRTLTIVVYEGVLFGKYSKPLQEGLSHKYPKLLR